MPRRIARLPGGKHFPSEHEIQCAVIEWWAYACKRWGLPEFALYAIPNAGAGAQKGQAGKMKAEGVRKGIPDLFLASPNNPGRYPGLWRGLYIEMKSANGKLSDEQRDVSEYLMRQGYKWVECRSVEAAQQAITDYLK